MLLQKGINQKSWYLAGGLFVLACITVFALTGSYFLLLLPFAALFAGLLLVNWKVAYWIFLFTIPVSMQRSFLNDRLSTSLPDEPLMWIFLLIFIVMFAARPNILPQWWWRSPFVLIILLQFLWLIVAVVFSKEPEISLKFLLAKCWFLVSLFILPVFIFKEKKDFRHGFLFFLIPLLATMAIILARHASMGFGFLLINKAIGIIYFNRVDYATIMSMFFPLVLAAIPLTKGMKLWWRAALVFILLFFLPAIWFAFARGAIMAVIFALVMGIAIRMKLGKLIIPMFYALVIFGVSFMVRDNKYIDYRPDFEHTYTHLTLTDHLVATFRGTDMSSMERLYRWIAGARMSTDRPLTGYGPNSFYYYYKPYAVTSFRTYVSRNMERSTTHNYFLFMLVEQGWPAMILYAILILVFFVQAQNTYHRFKDPFYRAATLAVAMMFAAGFINNFFSELIETHKVGALFYISIALIMVLTQKSKEEAAALAAGMNPELK
jgi:O-antigen ligase